MKESRDGGKERRVSNRFRPPTGSPQDAFKFTLDSDTRLHDQTEVRDVTVQFTLERNTIRTNPTIKPRPSRISAPFTELSSHQSSPDSPSFKSSAALFSAHFAIFFMYTWRIFTISVITISSMTT